MALNFEELVSDLESKARSENAAALKKEVEDALHIAEAANADSDIIDRLDGLLLVLTEASRENVCTNTKCPHYNRKCRMR
ncbi:MAG: hypothetical protein ACE14P_06805 [Methanotrichaceae archaeon]